MKSILALFAVFALAGCAATPYAEYANIHQAYAKAQEAKYQAIGAIAVSGDTTAKVAGMFALIGGGSSNVTPQIAAPKSAADSAREWAGIIVPSLMQGYGIFANTQMGMRQSDNATALGMSTNEAFVGMAGQIQAPAANVTLSGTGVLGSGSYSTDSHNIIDSYSPPDNSNQGNPVDNSNQGNPVDNSTAP